MKYTGYSHYLVSNFIFASCCHCHRKNTPPLYQVCICKLLLLYPDLNKWSEKRNTCVVKVKLVLIWVAAEVFDRRSHTLKRGFHVSAFHYHIFLHCFNFFIHVYLLVFHTYSVTSSISWRLRVKKYKQQILTIFKTAYWQVKSVPVFSFIHTLWTYGLTKSLVFLRLPWLHIPGTIDTTPSNLRTGGKLYMIKKPESLSP